MAASGQRLWKVITSVGFTYRVFATNWQDFSNKVWEIWHQLPWEPDAKVISPKGYSPATTLKDYMQSAQR